MSLANEIYDKAKDAGKIGGGSKYFSVVDKTMAKLPNGDETVVDVPNGNHKVRVISEVIGMGKDFNGKDTKQLQLTILDNGKKKEWNMPLTNQDGTLYFLIEKLREIAYLDGEEFLVRAKKLKTGKYSKEIIKISKGDGIPTIQFDEDAGDYIDGTGRGKKKEEDVSEEEFSF